MTVPCLSAGDTAVLVGFGVTGQSVAAALLRRNITPVVLDDRPSDQARAAAAGLGLELLTPDAATFAVVLDGASAILPTPGLPDAHSVFAAAAAAGVAVLGEFDLARQWDDRPILAITGTNGKTTVTTMVTNMMEASGLAAVAAGNTDIPLVDAIDDSATDVFVVEASSFRLGHAALFAPAVATWLNFDPDHLDVHASLAAYEQAKARIWRDQDGSQLAVINADDPVVARNAQGSARRVYFGLNSTPGPDVGTIVDGSLYIDGEKILAVDELRRSLPHDLSNALAAAMVARGGGATIEAIASTLASFEGLRHRVEWVGERDAVAWYNDSKATTPHAVVAALAGFPSAVLIAGGRNKGIDLSRLAAAAPNLRAVVAIGESAPDVEAAFDGLVPTVRADAMDAAVVAARSLAEPGDAVVLSPACASFDWYANYGARGDDFVRLVTQLVLEAP